MDPHKKIKNDNDNDLKTDALNWANSAKLNETNQQIRHQGMNVISHTKGKNKKIKRIIYIALAVITILVAAYGRVTEDAKEQLMIERGAEKIEHKDGYNYIIEYKLPDGVPAPTDGEIIGQAIKNIGESIVGYGESTIESNSSINRG